MSQGTSLKFSMQSGSLEGNADRSIGNRERCVQAAGGSKHETDFNSSRAVWGVEVVFLSYRLEIFLRLPPSNQSPGVQGLPGLKDVLFSFSTKSSILGSICAYYAERHLCQLQRPGIVGLEMEMSLLIPQPPAK